MEISFNYVSSLNLRLQNNPVRSLWSILIPHSRFWKYKTDLQDFSARVFPKSFQIFGLPRCWFFQKMIRNLFLAHLEWLYRFQVHNYWFWESWARPKIRKSWGWWLSGCSQSKIEKLLRSRIVLRSFWATLLSEFKVKMAPRPSQTPNLHFPGFSLILHRKS